MKFTDFIGRHKFDRLLDFDQRLATSASDEQGFCEAAPRVVLVIRIPALVSG